MTMPDRRLSTAKRSARRRATSRFKGSRLERMRAVLQRHVEDGTLPGLVALVHHRGRQHVEAIGSQTFGGGVPMARDTVFRLASMTKPITAVAAMMLVYPALVYLPAHWLLLRLVRA